MTTATLLTSLVGEDDHHFGSTAKSDAITTAQTWLGTEDGDSDAEDMATALLAQKILINREKSKDNQLSIDELITDEIRQLLAEDEKTENYRIVHYKKPSVDWR